MNYPRIHSFYSVYEDDERQDLSRQPSSDRPSAAKRKRSSKAQAMQAVFASFSVNAIDAMEHCRSSEEIDHSKHVVRASGAREYRNLTGDTLGAAKERILGGMAKSDTPSLRRRTWKRKDVSMVRRTRSTFHSLILMSRYLSLGTSFKEEHKLDERS